MSFFVNRPVIERISPKLSGLAEIIRRNACHNGRIAVFVQLKELRIGPHISAVYGSKNRDIAEQQNAVFIGVGF